MVILVLFLLTVIIALSYACFISVKKQENLEEYADALYNKLESAYVSVQTALKTMREIDAREIFEKDDEVGVAFSAITNALQELNNFFETNGEPDGETKEEQKK